MSAKIFQFKNFIKHFLLEIFSLFFYHLVTERFNLNGKMQMISISNFIQSWIIIARDATLFGAKFELKSWLHYGNHPPPPPPTTSPSLDQDYNFVKNN